jgi:hypothetical protein
MPDIISRRQSRFAFEDAIFNQSNHGRGRSCLHFVVIARLDRAIQYAVTSQLSQLLWNTGFPAFAGNDSLAAP